VSANTDLTYQLVGAIRRACIAIRDHYEGSLDGPRKGGNVGGGAASEEPPLPVSVHVLDARRETHMDLAHYARVIYGEVRDINGGEIQTRISDDEQGQPLELAAFIDRWAQRLAEEVPIEAETCADDLARHARRLKALALPDRRDWMPLGECPVTVADDAGNAVECGTQVRAYPDEDEVHRFVTCPGCGTEDTIQWWMSQIVPEASDLAHASAVIACVAMRTMKPLSHEQLRQWASREVIQRHGKDMKGRTLYSLAAVLAYVQTQTKEEVA
jgi:hypothetical protein